MAASKIPVWIKQCLDQYGNCACGRAITKKIGKDNLLQILENEGYPCELEILSDQKDKSAYPKDGTYILTLKNRQRIHTNMIDIHFIFSNNFRQLTNRTNFIFYGNRNS